ncbi:putative transmembrane protein [Rubellimicrobium mesophilum DSM 19309]|uniref:Putative transmembrane protein n=1 Tax=Rubellimicrobium mesophilum DSM 19309 TaxID=442562 RepID=A0A017HJ94_9RHOB|nr:DUF4178 domain-containing protein [Rubellimicrobium mesophilum]EYD73864.1 putative transmembrane protein [Rubellimicrobium mesophilum DSM 19309]
MHEYHCPNCGASFGPQLDSTRMMNCEFCGTSVVIDNDRLRLAGSRGVMHEVPLLFGLKDTVTMDGATWRILGHARFSYGRGTWDEFWAVDNGEDGAWISVDEGDVVVQRPLPEDPDLRVAGEPKLGGRMVYKGRTFMATEVETATCEAIRGSFPEVLQVGESYRFVNLTGEDGELLSGEFWPGGQSWSLGAWVDPFDVRKVSP